MKKLFSKVMLISVMIFFSTSILIAGEALDKNISKLIGMDDSSIILLKGYKVKGGFGILDNSKETGYWIDLGMQKGRDIIWLKKVTKRDASGHNANWKILDVIKLPAKQKNEMISWNDCIINGDEKNVSIVAFVDGKTFKVHRAWRGNIKSGKIEEISIKGITCEKDDI
jgi:hypothetical protein